MSLENLDKYKDEIIQLYKDGYLQREIAEMYNTSKSSIGRFLRANNQWTRIKLTEEDKEHIVELYESGLSMDKIAGMYHSTRKTVSEILRLYNVHIKTPSETGRKYTLNEQYFDVIDNQDKAYILGLLYADGCVTDKNGILLSLQEKDKDILYKINDLLESDRDLKYKEYNKKNNNWSNQYCLSIVNKHMAEQLCRLGVVPRKSLILKFPGWLSDDLYPHFIRGYMDGDGTIARAEKRAMLIGTEDFCNSLAIFLKNKLGIHAGVYSRNKVQETSTRMLRIAGAKQVKKFLDYIYNNANLFLDRKYDIYKSLYCINDTNNPLLN